MKKQTLLQEVKQLQKVAGLLKEDEDLDLSDTPEFTGYTGKVKKVFKKAGINFDEPVYIVDLGDSQDRETGGTYLNSNFENVKEPEEVSVPKLIEYVAQLEEQFETHSWRSNIKYYHVIARPAAPEEFDLPLNLTLKLEIWFFDEYPNLIFQ